MTITISRTKLALCILAVVLLVPATAYATHVFDDVPDNAFYTGPVEWAADNGITTGKSPTQFAPLDDVTRGESVTFLQRYDEKVVQVALEDLEDAIAELDEPQSRTVVFSARNAYVDGGSINGCPWDLDVHYIPLNLPVGATIQNVTANVLDTFSSAYEVSLRRETINTDGVFGSLTWDDLASATGGDLVFEWVRHDLTPSETEVVEADEAFVIVFEDYVGDASVCHASVTYLE